MNLGDGINTFVDPGSALQNLHHLLDHERQHLAIVEQKLKAELQAGVSNESRVLQLNEIRRSIKILELQYQQMYCALRDGEFDSNHMTNYSHSLPKLQTLTKYQRAAMLSGGALRSPPPVGVSLNLNGGECHNGLGAPGRREHSLPGAVDARTLRCQPAANVPLGHHHHHTVGPRFHQPVFSRNVLSMPAAHVPDIVPDHFDAQLHCVEQQLERFTIAEWHAIRNATSASPDSGVVLASAYSPVKPAALQSANSCQSSSRISSDLDLSQCGEQIAEAGQCGVDGSGVCGHGAVENFSKVVMRRHDVPSRQASESAAGSKWSSPSASANSTLVSIKRPASAATPCAHPVAAGSGDSGCQQLVFDQGRLVSGTLDALVQHFTPTSTHVPDRTFLFAFVLCSRLFIRPHQLLGRVCNSCLLDQRLGQVGITADALGTLGDNVISLLRHWTALFPHDFRDERMMRLLGDMLDRVCTVYPHLKQAADRIRLHLLQTLTELETYEQSLLELDKAPSCTMLGLVRHTDIYQLCPSTSVLAQQLTFIELERYRRVGPEEFIETFVSNRGAAVAARVAAAIVNGSQVGGDAGAPPGRQGDAASDRPPAYDSKNTHNLDAYIRWFNRLSYFVATEICMHLKKKLRARVIGYFIDVAKDCFNIGNFNSFMAIVSALNMGAIVRLTKTWSKVDQAKLKVLEQHVSPSNNFASYRSTLKAALWRSESAVYERARIVIPFFSLLIKDLHFFNETYSSRLDNGHVNFEKCWQLSKQLMEIFAWKQVECPFAVDANVQKYLLTSAVCSESALLMASYECEPPESSFERDQYRQLKRQSTPAAALVLQR